MPNDLPIDAMEQEEVDVSQLTTLTEQKEYCERMMDGIIFEEGRLNERLATVQTINNTVQSDSKLVYSLSEYLGYHYGRMDSSKSLYTNVINNLDDFICGKMDNIDHGARGMYISLWYNIGISSLEQYSDCLEDLEDMEDKIVELAMKDGKNVSDYEPVVH